MVLISNKYGFSSVLINLNDFLFLCICIGALGGLTSNSTSDALKLSSGEHIVTHTVE